jgi:hypothetical protein
VVKISCYSDVHYEHQVVTEFLVAETESLTNIHKQLENVQSML